MNVSLCLLLLALLFYIPYLLRAEKDLIYKGDIIVEKTPKRILLFSGYVMLLSIAAAYQYFGEIDIKQLPDYKVAKLLAAAILVYSAIVGFAINIKGYQFKIFDGLMCLIAFGLSFSFLADLVTVEFFAYGALSVALWIFFKFIGSINIL